MDGICVLGRLGILAIIGCVAFVVLGVPLFYTLITRWLTADGAPVIDRQDFVAAAGPEVAAPAAAPTPAAKVVAEPEPVAPKATEVADRDDLKTLPGLLAEMEAKLNSAGVRTYADLAGLGEGDVKRLGEQLSFRNGATWAAWKTAAGAILGGGEVAAAAPVAVESAVAEEPSSADANATKRDDLKVLPGLLAETEAKLNAAGVRRYADLASLEKAEVEKLGNQLSLRNKATWAAWKRGAANLLRDDLKALPGLLAETEAKLNAAGVSCFEKMASLSDAEIGKIGDAMSFRNRATWNAWRAKAAELQG